MILKKEQLKELLDLWQETQYGHYKKCREKHFEFADLLFKLYDEFYSKK